LSGLDERYSQVIDEPLQAHPFAEEFKSAVRSVLPKALGREDLQVTPSVGQGNWADVPWIGVFNPESTSSATRGIYLVYLYSLRDRAWYLCQGQGVTAVKEEFGRERKSELLRRAALIRERVPEHKLFALSGPVDLGGRTTLSKDYDPAVAYYVAYRDLHQTSEDQYQHDLQHMVRLYDQLVARGGTDNLETAVALDDLGVEVLTTLEEKRRYTRQRRIERDPKISREVKKVLGTSCQGCGMTFRGRYGKIAEGYIEAHHRSPLSDLPEDQPVPRNPRTDFYVLCANCHRVVHQRVPPLELDELKGLLREHE
jgi:5-methylcytosine-specific restriction protein A